MPKGIGGNECEYADEELSCNRCYLPLGCPCPYWNVDDDNNNDKDNDDDN